MFNVTNEGQLRELFTKRMRMEQKPMERRIAGRDLFECAIQHLIEAITLCSKSRLPVPSLILFYCTIDILAWLDGPENGNRRNLVGENFEAWVAQYLLPNTSLDCKAKDLYAARCSLVHSYRADPESSRKRKAKMIFYSWGSANNQFLRDRMPPSIATVHIDDLFTALTKGIECFKEALAKDARKADLVYKRAGEFLLNIDTMSLETGS